MEWRVNFAIQTLQIGQWKERKVLSILHCGQESPGFYKYYLSFIAYFVLLVAHSISIIPGDLSAERA